MKRVIKWTIVLVEDNDTEYERTMFEDMGKFLLEHNEKIAPTYERESLTITSKEPILVPDEQVKDVVLGMTS